MRKRRFLTQKAAFCKEENAALFSAYQRQPLFLMFFERTIFAKHVPEKAILDTYCRCFVVLKEVAGLLF